MNATEYRTQGEFSHSPGRRLQLDAVLLRESWREDEGRGGVVAEPVGASLVRLVAVDPDHDVAEAQDLDREEEGDGRSGYVTIKRTGYGCFISSHILVVGWVNFDLGSSDVCHILLRQMEIWQKWLSNQAR